MFTPLGWREQLVPEMVSWSLRTLIFVVRSLGAFAAFADSFGVGRPPAVHDLAIAAEELVPTARISGFITSPTSFRRRSRCLPPLVQGPAGSKSAPP